MRGGGQEQTTSSNAEGIYEFSSIAPANYSISVEAEGLNPFSKDGVTVQDSETAPVDVHLQLADVHTDVLVTGDSDLLGLAGQTEFIIETPEEYRHRLSSAAKKP